MDGIYVWEEHVDGQRFIFKGFLKEESFAWHAKIVDNQGTERWTEQFATPSKARAALVNRVPDEARFMKGVQGP